MILLVSDTKRDQQGCHARKECTQLDKLSQMKHFCGDICQQIRLEETSNIMEAPGIVSLLGTQILHCVGPFLLLQLYCLSRFMMCPAASEAQNSSPVGAWLPLSKAQELRAAPGPVCVLLLGC